MDRERRVRAGRGSWAANRGQMTITLRTRSGCESPCSAVASHLSIHHVRYVSAFAEELHHLFAGSCHLCPTGFRVRVLLQSSNLVSVEYEIHLSQTELGGPTNFLGLP